MEALRRPEWREDLSRCGALAPHRSSDDARAVLLERLADLRAAVERLTPEDLLRIEAVVGGSPALQRVVHGAGRP
jgi:hypothetical protein